MILKWKNCGTSDVVTCSSYINEKCTIRKEVKRQRDKEKAEELRALKMKHQMALLQKKQVHLFSNIQFSSLGHNVAQEEDEVSELMKEIEKRKEEEIRARLSQEKIKKELRQLDAVRSFIRDIMTK
jgi:hypothetical protein